MHIDVTAAGYATRPVLSALTYAATHEEPGDHDIAKGAWKIAGLQGVRLLTSCFNKWMRGRSVPEDWVGGVLAPIFKKKRNTVLCHVFS